MSCPFYGYHAARLSQMLVPQGGNQCAVRMDGYVPCAMEMEGQAPNWETCPLAKDHANNYPARAVELLKWERI